MRGSERVAERFRNQAGDYPWQTVRPVFGLLYFAGIPAAYFLSHGEPRMALAAGIVGAGLMTFFALLAWMLSI
jgi:hypothetical protein